MTCSECKIETLGEYGELCWMFKADACGVSRDTHLGAEGVSWDGKTPLYQTDRKQATLQTALVSRI